VENHQKGNSTVQLPESPRPLPSPTQSGIVEVNGAHVYYEMCGAGHPLVLLHAGIADCRQWDDQIEAFAAHYRVIRYDHRGWGRSNAPAGPVAFHDDLSGVLRALEIEHAHVLGISMGGTIAIDFALAYPSMVDALVLVGSWLSGYSFEASPTEKAIWMSFEEAVNARDFDRANQLEVDLKLAGIYRGAEHVDPAVRERLLRMHRIAFDRLDERELMRPWLHPEPPAAARLGEIRVPALIVYGDLDVPTVPQIAAHLAREMRDARTVVMRDTAHVPNMERAQEFNGVVLDFLAALPRHREMER
jgi:2-hydroxy-6-oxonona-2,4-dienedioate hydrolase